ncbi:hypothetical protein ACSQ67_000576 [Phaseolus vulgaris]
MRNVVIFSFIFLLLCVFFYAITSTKIEVSMTNEAKPFSYHIKALEFIWSHLGYQHVWPETSKLSSESSATCNGDEGYKYLPGCVEEGAAKNTRKTEVNFLGNIYWKEFVLVFLVWLAFVILQIAKNLVASCSVTYWILLLSQIPITVGFYLYQARALYQGRSAGGQYTHWPLHHLFLASICSLLAGIVGGLLGTGSGFVMGPLFLEVGILPQVASATATFGMMYSASLSVVQYYLLNRFPVPYALFLTLVAAIAAFLGQHLIDRLVNIYKRASLIIFVLAFTIFISTIALGECFCCFHYFILANCLLFSFFYIIS